MILGNSRSTRCVNNKKLKSVKRGGRGGGSGFMLLFFCGRYSFQPIVIFFIFITLPCQMIFMQYAYFLLPITYCILSFSNIFYPALTVSVIKRVRGTNAYNVQFYTVFPLNFIVSSFLMGFFVCKFLVYFFLYFPYRF